VEGLRKSERGAKHTFALEMVHNSACTCHKNLRVTLSIIIMCRIMFHICSWDADVVWARLKAIWSTVTKALHCDLNSYLLCTYYFTFRKVCHS
jgi:hypothetical protein